MCDKKQAELARWWQSPQGQLVQDMEKNVLSHLSSPFFGYHQVQIGGLERMPTLSKFLHGTLLSSQGDVNAKTSALPLKSHSVDNLLLQHVLEFQPEPHQVLREAERVLTADGKLILFSFNPFSLWGLQRLFSWQEKAPWCGKFYRQTRIRDWLALLNFEVVEYQRVLFRPTFESEKWLRRSTFFERWGKRLWPCFGSINVVVAAKRTIPVNPIRQKRIRTQLFPRPNLVNKPITRINKIWTK